MRSILIVLAMSFFSVSAAFAGPSQSPRSVSIKGNVTSMVSTSVNYSGEFLTYISIQDQGSDYQIRFQPNAKGPQKEMLENLRAAFLTNAKVDVMVNAEDCIKNNIWIEGCPFENAAQKSFHGLKADQLLGVSVSK